MRLATRPGAAASLASAAVAGALLVASTWLAASGQALTLHPSRAVAPGVTLYHLTDESLIDPPGPLSIWILRLDPKSADLRAALGTDEVMDVETVPTTAARHGALAAINGGFFFPNGDPQGIYKLAGQLISDTTRHRGAVGFVRSADGLRLLFDRLAARSTLVIEGGRTPVRVPIAGVDTTRRLGSLMLYTPAYHPHTDTAPGGLEWSVDGDPLRVSAGPNTAGKTAIPRNGFVLSFGGRRAPRALRQLRVGARVRIDTHYAPEASDVAEWESAAEIVGGAGLLARDGIYVDDWTVESFAKGFADLRHPRTMIGTRADGSIWLVTVDGRQPGLSVGMTLVEMRELARRLEFRNALNLDGGGSTTMWVKGEVVNSPSDAAGPRKVSDGLLVFPHP
jgi:hypothetical protein